MDKEEILSKTVKYVKNELKDAEGGHDWWHTLRVYTMAGRIAQEENANVFVVELAALLHDIADSKFHGGDETIGPDKAFDFLNSIGLNPDLCLEIKNLIALVSYKGGHNTTTVRSLELDILKDSDRLDAIGAIGIARTFNYGGFKGRPIYDPETPPTPGMSKEEYKKANGPSLNHFYEKLLLLKDQMHTEAAKKIAAERHEFMVSYLKQFYYEFEQGMTRFD